ncbi:MAG: hypothetical protein WC730_00795 [Patescibacteria group bacterium]|jgi:hypothetical protein
MEGDLQIPLGSSPITRRSSWRVIWIAPAILSAVLLGFCIFFLVNRLHSTAKMTDSTATMTVRIFTNPKTKTNLMNHIGNEPLFANAPWTWKEVLTSTNNELTVNYHEALPSSIVFDKKICSLWSEKVLESDYLCEETNGMSMIHEKDATILLNSKEPHFLPIPWKEGYWFDRDLSTDTRGMVNISKTSISYSGYPGVTLKDQEKTIEGNAIAEMTFSDESLPGFESTNGSIGIKQNNEEMNIEIVFQPFDISIDQLALLNKNIYSQLDLATTAWTMEDGSTVQEIRSMSDDTGDPTIETNDNETIITQNNESREVVTKENDNQEIRIIANNVDVFMSSSQTSNEDFNIIPSLFLQEVFQSVSRLEQYQGYRITNSQYSRIVLKNNRVIWIW